MACQQLEFVSGGTIDFVAGGGIEFISSTGCDIPGATMMNSDDSELVILLD